MVHISKPHVCDDMTPIESSRPSKRRRDPTEQLQSIQNNLQLAKRRKIEHPTVRPPEFWDNLPDLDLTPTALEEWERRTTAAHGVQFFPRVNPRCPSAACLLSRFKEVRRLQLKHIAANGGPDLSDIRGVCVSPKVATLYGLTRHQYPVVERMTRRGNNTRQRGGARAIHNRFRSVTRSFAAGSVPTTATPKTRTTKSKPYDRAFQQHLIRHGIFPDAYVYPIEEGQVQTQAPRTPDNLKEIREMLARPCPQLSPGCFTDEQFEKFACADAQAAKEHQVKTYVIPYIEGEIADKKCVFGEILFNNLDHLTDGTLTASKPDLFYGARPEKLDQRICDQLSGHIVPSTQEDLPILANFFLAVKGPDGTLAVAKRQALYDGALGERGLLSLRIFIYGDADLVYDNKAYTISETYHGGVLKIYAIHAIPPAADGSACHGKFAMTQVKGICLTGGPEEYRSGVTAHTNAKAWAGEQRDRLIRLANQKVCGGAVAPPPPAAADVVEADDTMETDADEPSVSRRGRPNRRWTARSRAPIGQPRYSLRRQVQAC